MTLKFNRALFLVFAILCLFPEISGAMGLIAGITFALLLGNPFLSQTKQWAPKILSYSVAGLGAGMNLMVIAKVGAQGVGYTFIGITLTMILGIVLGKILKVTDETSLLVSAGTAICGGSAIAAVSASVNAKSENTSVALITVFFLNAVALLVFPFIGHYMGLDESQFGLWSALAIHDTSSVVGAAMKYGPHALEVATTIKLARALWIIPLVLVTGFFIKKPAQATKVKRPWFILWFLMAAAIVTWIPSLQPTGAMIAMIAKRTFVLTLFLIGAGLTREALKNVGFRPFALGILLWIIVATSTLVACMTKVISTL